jgi:hypothetical protein
MWYIIFKDEYGENQFIQRPFYRVSQARQFIEYNQLRGAVIVSEDEMRDTMQSDRPFEDARNRASSIIKRPMKYKPFKLPTTGRET